MATRSIISGTKPTETPSASSDDVDTQAKPTLQRKHTNHYERAAAAATKADEIPATTAGSAAASVTDRPGMQRQQSWKRSDLRGQQQAQMLGRASGQGYSSTQK
ncbi:hypothetical protein LTR37_016514 [Vermiconidia calcicola]|uniref:Uncharacterized protein n=1 Tax=Vermiconidia calcicola TaxID=1690605 RepID=A0ACC3MNA3_9PEZI|nr:hypothetical protein LTR37_016514 [Vermiconidia calcicola]